MNNQILELVGMACIVGASYFFANKHKKENDRLIESKLDLIIEKKELIDQVEKLTDDIESRDKKIERLENKIESNLVMASDRFAKYQIKISKQDDIIAFDTIVLSQRMNMIDCLNDDLLGAAKRHFKDQDKIVNLEEEKGDLRKKINGMKKSRKIKKTKKLGGVR